MSLMYCIIRFFGFRFTELDVSLSFNKYVGCENEQVAEFYFHLVPF